MNTMECVICWLILCCGVVAAGTNEWSGRLDKGYDIANASAAYYNGNYAKARDLSLKAAAAGDARAQNTLCAVYLADNNIYPPGDEEAASLGKTVAERAELRVAAKHSEAFKWCQKSAAQGNFKAEVNLGYMYRMGLGCRKDYGMALKLYKKAAEVKDSKGEYYVGYMYSHGYGVKQDNVVAMQWFDRAAAHGETSAMVGKGIIYEFGHGVDKNEASAMKWYRMAAEKGDPYGAAALANMYRSGRGVPKDEAEAVKWYKKAAAGGSDYAQEYLDYLSRKVGKEAKDNFDGLHEAVDFGKP